ncbi:hypothetical protein Sango_2592700 [Sesamum angolense]|uniref:DUF659 domain-containing protein n=1 Tax=Sesamum angolense TaxID=2727404 RepID=A0AAE1W5N6_9LAMI|nr:hypothetical protein Sango_2592700 [Sesamum angolense]
MSKVASMDHGYAGPSYHALRVSLLKDAKKQVSLVVDSFRSKLIETGCTIMGDGWKDSRQRPLVNFLVCCPSEISFIKSVDVSAIESTAENLCNLFAEIVEMVGVKNVIHLVTDNATNYKVAGRLLSEKYPTICWSPCAAHCVNLILKDIGMYKAKKAIKALFRNKKRLYQQYVDIINVRWDKMLRKSLHAAAYYLNPAFQVKYSKRPYDPVDYECIDKSEFWIVEETPECELDYDEMEELLEEEMPRYDEESSFDPETSDVEPIVEADLEQFGRQSRSTYYSDNENEDDWD